MTREEQIDWLCRLRSNIQCYMDVATLQKDVKEKFVEVLSEIISALEQEPCETSTDEPMTMVYPTIFCDDAISREAVTNGEVIKKTFPHYDIEIDEHKGYARVFYEDFYTTYPWRWWNAPYQKGGKE